MKKHFLVLLLAVFLFFQGNAAQQIYSHSVLQSVDFGEVKLTDNFWVPKIVQLQDVTLPLLFDIAERQGKLDNFRIIAGRKQGKLRLYNAPDSDVYKLLEAAGYSFATRENKKLQQRTDSIIDDIVAAQDSSGYLHTQYMVDFAHPAAPSPNLKNVITFGFGPQNRWQSFKYNWPFAYSQLYCAGHLMEAGVAYYKGCGKRKLLDAAIRMADLICKEFSLEKIKQYGDHPEVEIGLMQLYELTGKNEYLQKADEFSRYVNFSRPPDIHKEENSKPLYEQSCAYGHCVRTAYIYSGATDVIRATGAQDLTRAIFSIWKNITSSKMYVHGGTGNGTEAEQHGENYDLPVLPTYSECCANIAEAQWNYRLNLLTGNKKYADLVEWLSYNSALSGISCDGRRFAYSNKLNIDDEHRKDKHSGVRESYLFCCPSKLPVFMSGIGRWMYAKNEKGLFVNLFIGSKVATSCNGNTITLSQKTDYPLEGKVVITIEDYDRADFQLNIRIPQWLSEQQPISESPYFFDKNKGNFKLLLNGKRVGVEIRNGYIYMERKWNKGDVVELRMEMLPRRIYTDEVIAANKGRVAISRGPLLYCLEGIDHPFDISQMVLPAQSMIKSAFDVGLFGGIYVLKGKGKIKNKTVRFNAIPYYLWENRGIYTLRTLLIENPDKAIEEQPKKDVKMNTNG